MTQDGDKSENDQESAQNAPVGDGKSESPPEVEAEVVDAAAIAGGAFDDADDADDDLSDDPDDGVGAARAPILTPGVMLFGVFAIVALLAFAVWRMQSAGQKPPAEITAPDEAALSEQLDVERASLPAKETPATPEKISNVDIDGMKRAPGSADEAPAAGDGFLPSLPPLPDGSGPEGEGKLANQFDSAAKTAPAPISEPVEELASAQASPDAEPEDAAPEDVQATAPVDAPPAPPAIADVAGSKNQPTDEFATSDVDAGEAVYENVERDMADLRAALAREQQANAALRDDMAQMRTDVSAALAARDAQMAREVESLRAAMTRLQNDDGRAAKVQVEAGLSLAALKRAVKDGAPFAAELASVAGLAPDLTSASSARLGAHAQTGVPALEDLRRSFGAAARAGLIAARQEQAGGGMASLMARASSVVTVWPSEPRAGDAPGAVISRAESALASDDIADALEALSALPDAAQTAMADWLRDARIRAEALSMLSELDARLAGAMQ